MASQSDHTLVNVQNGNIDLSISPFSSVYHENKIQRNGYYSLIWIQHGCGKLKVDFSEYDFEENTMFSFSPYQPFMFKSDDTLSGVAIHFHPDFYCIQIHQKEVACNGLLFNNAYEPPLTIIDASSAETFDMLVRKMKEGMSHHALAQNELLLSYLKILLISVSRLKAEQQPGATNLIKDSKEPFILQDLKYAIEKHFKNKHSAGDYADSLNISAKALTKITKAYFNKTPKDLISERIIIEAKRELYLTSKTIKEIAYELGYQDEYYFSRFFKANANISPQVYRETVGFGRG
jgi:AraC family transcriptional regulator, transcriptional activator of pobA